MPARARLAAYLSLPLAYIVTPTASTAATTPLPLRWTAPGDDGNSGRATRYDLRYSTQAITASNFSSARAANNLPLPSPAGTTEFYTLNGLSTDTTYYVAIKTVDEKGNWSGMSNVKVRQRTYSTAAIDDSIGGELSFAEPWPNPAHRSVNFSFRLPQAGEVSVDVFDVTGRRVCMLASGWRGPGPVSLVWNLRTQSGDPVASGTYVLLARASGKSWTRRVSVLT